MKFNEEKLKFDSLIPIKDSKIFFSKLNQLMHNLTLSKDIRYKGFFQMMLCKYYDEKFNSKNLQFTSHIKDIESFKNNLWKKAVRYYDMRTEENLNIKKKLIFSWEKIKKIIKFIEQFSLIKSDSKIIQDFFMKFGSKILKIDLSQFYTPIPIINFIVESLDIKNNQFIIDPAGGSADFLTGIIQKYKNNPNYDEIKNNLNYWDNSKEAIKVALLNMILNADGKTNIILLDSIKNFDKNNGKYDFVLTNPPFGQNVKWEGDIKIMDKYKLSEFATNKKQHLGILFIERSMKLLKKNGMLVILLPSGYLNNSSQKFIREFLINNYKIIADISLPQGAFKGSNTGVKTDILYVQKTKIQKPYKIFTDYVYKLGYDYRKKELPILYKINNKTGKYIYNQLNEKIIDSDLDLTLCKIKKFAYDESIINLEKEKNENLKYNYLISNEFDKNLKIKPELNDEKILKILNDKESFSLNDLKKKNNIKISKSTDNINELIINEEKYSYITIKKAKKGLYELDNKIYGWKIKKIKRAKQIAKKNCIYISYLFGSMKKFFLFQNNSKNVIVTNGMFCIDIKDEKIRLSFYKFLFSENYLIQFEAFTTGHIMTNISEEDILSWKFKMLNDKEFKKFKEIVSATNKFLDTIYY